jgi:hypothetical protein
MILDTFITLFLFPSPIFAIYALTLTLTLTLTLPFLLSSSFLHYQENYYLTFSQNTILPQKTDLDHFPEHPPQPAIMCAGAY